MDMSIRPLDDWMDIRHSDMSICPLDEWTFKCPLDISVCLMDGLDYILDISVLYCREWQYNYELASFFQNQYLGLDMLCYSYN